MRDKVNLLGEQDDFLPSLIPLNPTKQGTEHLLYVNVLNKALEDDGILNIALTGSHGSGKSSIFKDLEASLEPEVRDKLLYISFSNLGADLSNHIASEIKTKDRTEVLVPDKGNNLAADKANLIQKEIVKQILYKERYSKVRMSRFPKIFHANLWPPILWATFIILVCTVLSYTGGLIKIDKLEVIRASIFVSVSFIALYSILYFLIPTLKNMKINNITGGAAGNNGSLSISLTSSGNYFDQYLDEIIYFFEVTDYKVVILEDIDRFGDLYIFEKLRQLNKLLNESKQINKSIKFIYAVKDSIFTSTENQATDVNDQISEISENRTKFFDLIIPTVPFITIQSSRDFMNRHFNSSIQVEDGVIGITSKYLTDKRLLTNVFNEFQVFYKRIFIDGSIDDLSPSKLLAIIVYKNLFLNDFECIRLGTSKLDKIFQSGRDFVKNKIADLNTDINRIRDKLNSLENLDKRCELYGQQLITYIVKRFESSNVFYIDFIVNEMTFNTLSYMLTSNFWSTLSKLNADGLVAFNVRSKANFATSQIHITKSDIERVVGHNISTEMWLQDESDKLVNQIDPIKQEIELLKSYDVQHLIHNYSNFNQIVLQISGEGLLHELLSTGYIDANFILYTSIYLEEHISANAMNYVLQTVQRNKTDYDFKFKDELEIMRVLDILDVAQLESRSIYNFEIVNLLLKNGDPRIDIFIKTICTATSDDLDFLALFLSSKNNADALIAKLVKQWAGIFNYIITLNKFSNEVKNHFLGIAIVNADPNLSYDASDSISEYLSTHFNEIESVLSSDIEPYAETISRILILFDVKIDKLEGVGSKKLIKLIAVNDLYRLNTSNLNVLIGSDNFSLSHIKTVNLDIFERLCQHLDQYIAIAKESNTKFSVENSADFKEILIKTHDQAIYSLEAFIKLSTDSSYIDDITEIDYKLWPLLFKYR